MKILQNDFTTPEQSKRLLELGVPADSADCYYTQEEIEGNMYWFDLHIKRQYQPHTSLHASTIWGETLPCWSVGRLMEIYDICFIYPKSMSSCCAYTKLVGILYTNYILDCYKNAIADKLLDFSKLNEYDIRENND